MDSLHQLVVWLSLVGFYQAYFKQTNLPQFHGEVEDIVLRNSHRIISISDYIYHKSVKVILTWNDFFLLVNNGVVIGSVIATIAVVSAIIFSLSSVVEIPNSELIVSNGNHLETVGEVTSIQTSSKFSLMEIFEKTEASVVQVNVRSADGRIMPGSMGSGFVYSDDCLLYTSDAADE